MMKIRTWSDYLYLLIGIFFLAIILRWTVVSFYFLPSESMLPTFKPRDYVLVNKLAYGLRFIPGGSVYWELKAKPGDVVLFSLPNKDEKLYVKRVIALAGQSVELKEGIIVVNDQVQSGQGLKGINLAKQNVPEGHVFVLNDNLSNPEDSRSFGPVPEKYLQGKVIYNFQL